MNDLKDNCVKLDLDNLDMYFNSPVDGYIFMRDGDVYAPIDDDCSIDELKAVISHNDTDLIWLSVDACEELIRICDAEKVPA